MPEDPPVASDWANGDAPMAEFVELSPHRRGSTFVRTFQLNVPWTGEDFTGGVKVTFRREIPEDSGVTDDADAVDQATVLTGEITFAGEGTPAEGETPEDPCIGTITIPASRANLWPLGRLVWDAQGTISGAPDVVHDLAYGTIVIKGDVTRS
jgi:hypothetical protein